MSDIRREILEHYQVRNTKKQKNAFLAFAVSALERQGYTPKVETIKRNQNLIVGNPETADVMFTAHYDTCTVLFFPNFIIPNSLLGFILSQVLLVVIVLALFFGTILLVGMAFPSVNRMLLFWGLYLLLLGWALFGKPNPHTANDNTSGVVTVLEAALAMPKEYRERVCFVLFDNEEKGLLGSSAFAKRHKTVRNEGLIVNFDCVSDGDLLVFFPTKAMKKQAEVMELIPCNFLGQDGKQVQVNSGFGMYPSDNMSFKQAFGVCALKQGKVFDYMDRIHTVKDTVFDQQNIDILVEGILRFAEQCPQKSRKP